MSADRVPRVCRDCGAPWVPVRRQECSRCGSDAGSRPARRTLLDRLNFRPIRRG